MTGPFHGFPDFQPALDVADLIVNQQGIALPGAGIIILGTFDMRQQTSYAIMVEIATNAVATAYNGIQIGVAWYMDAAATQIIYEDVNGIFARDSGAGAFTNDAGRFEIGDNCHGPFMQLVANNVGPDACTVSFNLYGTSRQLGRRYVRNSFGGSGFAIDALDSRLVAIAGNVIGVGVTQTTICRYAPGPCWLSMLCVGAPGTFRFLDVTGTDVLGRYGNVGAEEHFTVQLPKSALRVQVTNAGGVPMTYSINMVTGRDSM